MFYAIKDGKRYPFFNDADENGQDKLRLETDLNEVVIGHMKNYDNTNDYYSKVNTWIGQYSNEIIPTNLKPT